eukprot:3001728-Prymnesium_polylepis.1
MAFSGSGGAELKYTAVRLAQLGKSPSTRHPLCACAAQPQTPICTAPWADGWDSNVAREQSDAVPMLIVIEVGHCPVTPATG